MASRFWHRRPWIEKNHWALDLETTGLDPRRDQIVSAGLVPIERGAIRWGERRYWLVRPVGITGSDAVTVHGLLPEELTAAMPVSELVAELAPRLRDTTLVVHWGRLDLRFLRRAFRAQRVPWPGPEVVDTVHLLHRLDRRRGLLEPFAAPTPTPLAPAREALGLPPHEQHHALYDALATAELYLLLRSRLAS